MDKINKELIYYLHNEKSKIKDIIESQKKLGIIGLLNSFDKKDHNLLWFYTGSMYRTYDRMVSKYEEKHNKFYSHIRYFIGKYVSSVTYYEYILKFYQEKNIVCEKLDREMTEEEKVLMINIFYTKDSTPDIEKLNDYYFVTNKNDLDIYFFEKNVFQMINREAIYVFDIEAMYYKEKAMKYIELEKTLKELTF